MKKFYTTKKVIMLLIMAMTATSVLQAQTMKVKKIVSEGQESSHGFGIGKKGKQFCIVDMELSRGLYSQGEGRIVVERSHGRCLCNIAIEGRYSPQI